MWFLRHSSVRSCPGVMTTWCISRGMAETSVRLYRKFIQDEYPWGIQS